MQTVTSALSTLATCTARLSKTTCDTPTLSELQMPVVHDSGAALQLRAGVFIKTQQKEITHGLQ